MSLHCNRCGEKLRADDLASLQKDGEGEKIVQIGYSGLSDGVWRTMTICLDCQKELRNEFYMRRLTNEVMMNG